MNDKLRSFVIADERGMGLIGPYASRAEAANSLQALRDDGEWAGLQVVEGGVVGGVGVIARRPKRERKP